MPHPLSRRFQGPGRVAPSPIGDDDAALVAGLREGRREACAALVERYADDLERVLFRVLGPDPEIDDLLHDVLLAALGSLHKLRDPDKLRGWLVSIAVNRARKCIRTRSRWRFIRLVQPSELPEREAPSISHETSEALRCTYAVLEGMGADDRIFFALRFIDGMELTAIAECTGVSLATVKRRIQRARGAFTSAARKHPALEEWLQPEADA